MDTVMFANKLELRYCFNDKSDYIDAAVKNRCEKAVLTIMQSVAEMLEVRMMIYNEPYQADGFRELWAIAGRQTRAISIVLSITMQLLTRPTLSPKGEPIDILTQKEKEGLKQNLSALCRQLKEKKRLPLLPGELITRLNMLPRIRKSKTQFYEAVKSYPKIVKIAVRELNEKNRGRSSALEVKRDKFNYFIYKAVDEEYYLQQRIREIDKRQLSIDFDD